MAPLPKSTAAPMSAPHSAPNSTFTSPLSPAERAVMHSSAAVTRRRRLAPKPLEKPPKTPANCRALPEVKPGRPPICAPMVRSRPVPKTPPAPPRAPPPRRVSPPRCGLAPECNPSPPRAFARRVPRARRVSPHGAVRTGVARGEGFCRTGGGAARGTGEGGGGCCARAPRALRALSYPSCARVGGMAMPWR